MQEAVLDHGQDAAEAAGYLGVAREDLAGPDASFVTGATLNVNGGFMA